MHHFGKIDFVKFEMGDYSAHFYEKFVLKKSMIFVKFKKQSVVCGHEFSWFTKKVVCTTYFVFSALLQNKENMFIQLHHTDPVI